MQPTKILASFLEENSNEDRYLYSMGDLRCLCMDLTQGAFRTLLNRATRSKLLEKVCRNIYAYKPDRFSRGLILYHTAAHLRSNMFNYISLESALSQMGVISQVPIGHITLMSSGRSNSISCGRFGTIEFVHTDQPPQSITDHLAYDSQCRLWRADIAQALRDMRRTYRSLDLIDWSVVHEFV